MSVKIDRIDLHNYSRFDDMVFWRQNGVEREPSRTPVSERMKRELSNPNLHVYAVEVESRYVGWISLVYIPKIGSRWNGRGHVYVDELWVAPGFRGRGYATEGLRLTLDVARGIIPEEEIYLRVDKTNPASLRVMMHNGGYIHHEDDIKYYVRIKK